MSKPKKEPVMDNVVVEASVLILSTMILCFGNSVKVSAADHTLRWIDQGPGPTQHGQTQGDLSVAGAINAIVTSPTDANIIYVGTVNGGVWRTQNGTAANPSWEPRTDEALPGLSIKSLAFSPVHSNTVFAGTGSTSSFSGIGPAFGVARSTDGGKRWAVLASSTFQSRTISSIVPTRLSHGNVVLAATSDSGGGVFRSTDLGNSFSQISGVSGTGLPAGGVSSLVRDPDKAGRLYAGLPSFAGAGSQAGVYRSLDGGLTWTAVSSGISGLATSSRILLAVHSSIRGNVVYAAVISSGSLSGVFRSTNQGGAWVSMGVPTPAIFPGHQGSIHGAIVAHPTDINVVFISGDRQDVPFPNANGCTDFTGNTFRGNAALLPGNPWGSVDCTGANGTSPHADSRAMTFDINGDLLQANDGGIYRLTDPNLPERQWYSANGNIGVTEFHSIAYDSVSHIILGGAQDTGTPMQSASGSLVWNEFLEGDGGNVAVDSDQTAHAGTSIRYSSFQSFMFFNRSTWDASNNQIFSQPVGLTITAGPGTGQNLLTFDHSVQFSQPYVLNKIDPSRMLVGTTSIYESLNRGDSLTNLHFAGVATSALAYGGRLNGVANPDVFYVAGGSTILHRVTLDGPITSLSAYPGSAIRGLVIDPNNYQRVFVLDSLSRVWGSFDEGATWTNLTETLGIFTSNAYTIEVISVSTDLNDTLLVVGGERGVFRLRHPPIVTDIDDDWHILGKDLPHGIVWDLHFNYEDNVLVAGMLGRGAWKLPLVDCSASSFVACGKSTEGGPSTSSPGTDPPLVPPQPVE